MRVKTSLLDYVRMGLKGLCLDCQQSDITEGRFKLKEYCRSCGGKVERNGGDGWGFLVLIDRAVFLFPLVVALFFRLDLKVFIASAVVMTGGLIVWTSKRLSLSLAIERWLSSKF